MSGYGRKQDDGYGQ